MRTTRLHLRIEEALMKKVRAYAKKNHLTVTSIVTQLILELLAKEEAERLQASEAEQI